MRGDGPDSCLSQVDYALMVECGFDIYKQDKIGRHGQEKINDTTLDFEGLLV